MRGGVVMPAWYVEGDINVSYRQVVAHLELSPVLTQVEIFYCF